METQSDREILAQEARLTEATQNLDVAALNGLYADDIIFTGVTGAICDKHSVMDEVRRGLAERKAATTPEATAVVAYEKDDIRAIRHGDTGVASYRFGVTIRGNGQEVVRRYRTTNVWMKRASGWQVVAAHTATLG